MNDTLVRAMSKDGMVKATAVYTRALTERARQIHRTSPVATAALGRALAGVSMMGNALKGSGESVTLQIKGDGPLGTIPRRLRRRGQRARLCAGRLRGASLACGR